MKKIIVVALLCSVPFSCGTHIRLYSRALEEQRVADSLRTIDSLRIVDSLRVADSLKVARYRAADETLKKEKEEAAGKEKQEAEAMQQLLLVTREDTTAVSEPGEKDIISARAVAIEPDNPYAKEIDSLQVTYDRLNGALHDNDNWFKNMKAFPVSEKKRYIHYLLQYGMKDSSAIIRYCNSLSELYRIKLDLLLAIKKSQHGNTKGFIQHHIDKHKRKMGELGDVLFVLTPKVPSYLQRTVSEPLPCQ